MRSHARMPRAIEITAYRLAGEAIPRGGEVSMVVDGDDLEIRTNQRLDVSAGLRERIETLDGTIEADDDGLLVRLPIGQAPDGSATTALASTASTTR
jgi:hypothetical protein